LLLPQKTRKKVIMAP